MRAKLVTAFFIVISSFSTVFASDYTLTDFKYPQTDVSFINKAIELRKADTDKNFESLFTQQPSAEKTACGQTAADVVALTTGMYAELGDPDKMAKIAKRNTGMDMTLDMNYNINPQILSFTCRPDGKPAEITVRYNSRTTTETSGFKFISDAVNVKTVYFSNAKPQYYRVLSFITNSGTGAQLKPFLSSSYGSPSTGEYITFMHISVNNTDTLVYNQAVTNEKTRITTWTNGNPVSITNMKKGLMHGEFKMMDIKTKFMTLPGFTKCYKNGSEVKTTGACDAD